MSTQLTLGEIDSQGEEFRISEPLECKQLLRSISEIGQLHPVILLRRKDSKLRIVSGFRRFRALHRLGAKDVEVRILDECDTPPLQVFSLALWENLSQRELNLLEKARALHVLCATCGLSPQSVIGKYLPALGLPPVAETLEVYLLIHRLDEGLRALLLEGKLTSNSALRLARSPASLQHRISAIMGQVHLTASMQRQFLDMLEEIARMEGVGPVAVLESPEIGETLCDFRLSPVQRGQSLHRIMQRRRYPRLSQALNRFEERKRMLSLPAGIRIFADPYFEKGSLQVRFDADNARQFREMVQSLCNAAESERLEGLFHVL